MKKIVLLVISIISIVTLINWRAPEPTVEGDLKNKVNFSGILITHQGEKYNIDNISVAGKYKQITMYDKPSKYPKAVYKAESKRREIQLDINPITDLAATKIDLSEIKELQVPEPNTTWTYQKKKKHRILKFTEVIIISNSDTKRHYLLERKTKIYCDEIDEAGPLEKIIPLPAIDRLIIEGYTFRNSVVGGTATKKPKPIKMPLQSTPITPEKPITDAK